MQEIEFSIIEDAPDSAARIPQLLENFQNEYRVRVRLRLQTWENAWQELFTIITQGKGPDVSHVGSTWCNSLVEMNALRPFTSREVAAIGGSRAFVASDWKSVTLAGDSQVWAVPWYSYLYLICYRRDVLRQAGINEETAFGSAQALAETARGLAVAGVENPLIVPPFPFTDLLHTSASWVWEAGGDFISDDGKRTSFNQPDALAGFKAYFELRRGMTPAALMLNYDQCHNLFAQGQAAMILTNSDAIQTLAGGQAVEIVRGQLGTAIPTRVPWFGGGNLVIWRHTQGYPERERAAVALVNYLAGQAAQIRRAEMDAAIPARLDALQLLALQPSGLSQTVEQAVSTGRPYKIVPLWRRIEYQLGQELVQLQSDLDSDPAADVETILRSRLEPLARRMNLTLSQ